jgi:hypothetical protein
MNITRAIITKSIRFPVKSPTRNLMFPNDSVAALQSPPGMTAPIIGIIRSVTSDKQIQGSGRKKIIRAMINARVKKNVKKT